MNNPLFGCIVAPSKITHYLLSLSSEDGASKAVFFMKFGFDRNRPDELSDALRQQAVTHPIVDHWSDENGEHWDVVGPVISPDGRNPTVRTGWVKDSEMPPRLATAFPG